MRISILEFGSLLSYSPYGMSRDELYSKEIKRRLKIDDYVMNPPILMSDFLAQEIQRSLTQLPFAHFFRDVAAPFILVPIRKSSLMKEDEWWVPQNIARALVRRGLGYAVEECLERSKAVPTSHTVQARDRPTVLQQYESLEVHKLRMVTSKPREILLIDDIVTSGSAFLGAANRLADEFPDARIRALAMIRTISNSPDFVRIWAPVIGTITLRDNYRTHREP
jgi:predicted amidophosphoribosyltransferase